MIVKFASALFVVAIGASSANATTAYDGSWTLIIRTVRGACDPTYNFQVDIRNGVVSHANIVRLKGRVTGKGAVRVSVAVPGKVAAGSGRLTRNAGGGRWSGRAQNERCSGTWTAQRY